MFIFNEGTSVNCFLGDKRKAAEPWLKQKGNLYNTWTEGAPINPTFNRTKIVISTRNLANNIFHQICNNWSILLLSCSTDLCHPIFQLFENSMAQRTDRMEVKLQGVHKKISF